MSFLEIIPGIFMIGGALITLVASVGLLRLPDFYTRLHAAGKGDTLGQFFILTGLILSAGFSLVSLKLAIIIVFIMISNPTASHALARAAWRIGLKPTTEHEPHHVEQYEGQLSSAEEREQLMLPVMPASIDDVKGV